MKWIEIQDALSTHERAVPALRFPAWVGVGTFLLALTIGCAQVAPPPEAEAAKGCSKDTDCKGDRICEQRTCVSPSAQPMPSVTEASARPVPSGAVEPVVPGGVSATGRSGSQRVSQTEINQAREPQMERVPPEEAERRYGWGAPETLEKFPELLKLLKALDPSFTPRGVGTSQTPEVVRLAAGREVVLLWGCTPHGCGGSTYAIAYDVNNKQVAFLKEIDTPGTDAVFTLFGAPDAALRDALFYFSRRD